MALFTNPFVEVVNQMNGIPTSIRGLEDSPELQARYQARAANMYITMQQVLAQVSALLAPGEQILNMLPMTNEENSSYATGGLMGLYAARHDRAKTYIKEQASLRGNRLLLFTNTRMIFFIVIEFLDDPTAYYSYRYDQIKAITFKKHKMSVPGDKFWRREYYSWYTIDFETADRHIFNEILTNVNGEAFLHNLVTIPGLRQIELVDHIARPLRLDNYASSLTFVLKVLAGLIGFVVLLELVGLLLSLF